MFISSSLSSLIVLPAIFALTLKWPKSHGNIIHDSRVGLVRRSVAFTIDLTIAAIGVFPFSSMLGLFLEYLATGVWAWSFERDFFRASDLLAILGMLLAFYGIFYYFKWHFKNEKQTLGQHLLNFKLIPSGENSSMGMRAFIALCNFSWWPIWPWTIFKRKQDYWWDTSSKIKARRVQW